MDAFLSNSDTLLRPDVGLLFPALAAYFQSWPLLLLGTALQPLKWQSGCGCFVGLCARKRFSIRVAAVLAVVAAAANLTINPSSSDSLLIFAAMVSAIVLSKESVDTKILKAIYMSLTLTLPGFVAIAVSIVVTGCYAYATGWRIRGSGSVDVAAANKMWLITKDGRLAKRVNKYGELHLEYMVNGRRILVGNGRLVGEAGANLRSGLNKDNFVQDDGNNDTFRKCEEGGQIVVKQGLVAICG